MRKKFNQILNYEKEEEFLNLFYCSDKKKIYEYIEHQQNNEFNLPINYNNKYLNLLIFITTISRSLIEHGVPAEVSLLTAENLMNIMLLKDNLQKLNQFEYKIIDFFYDIYTKPINTTNHTIIRILNYIYKNLGENITVKKIAGHLNMSESYISSIFNDQMNVSLKLYINKQKIERAKQILRDSDNNILEVSILTGYTNQSYFAKLFKQFTKLSPTKYRSIYRTNIHHK